MAIGRVPGRIPMQRRRGRCMVVALLAVPFALAACGGTAAEEAATEPAVSEQVKGSDVVRVTLTAEAARRLGIQTAPVRRDESSPERTVIPYAAVLYDPSGETWTYTSPKPFVFERRDIVVEKVVGDSAVLAKGPPPGTAVVTVGATEIWGVEYGGIEED